MATAPLSFPIHRITNDEYVRMVDAGALEGVRVELAEGLLVDLSPQGELHARMVQVLTRLLGGRLELLRVQLPLAVAEGWIPEPDIALVEHEDPTTHPVTAVLAVEVAVSTHQYDLSKARVFAQAGIPAYWVVDVPGRQVLAHTEPRPSGYARVRALGGGGELDPGVPGLEPFTVDQLFATAFGER
ncbi:MAG: Uma2 family endonuclease [Actinomycetota bacterium]|nr:Uma2 family endonuclease [Actinomycetota bacterium]